MNDAPSIDHSSVAIETTPSRVHGDRGAMAADSALGELIRLIETAEPLITPRKFVFKHAAAFEVLREELNLPWELIAEQLRKKHCLAAGRMVSGKRLASYLCAAKKKRAGASEEAKNQYAQEKARFTGLFQSARRACRSPAAFLPRPAAAPLAPLPVSSPAAEVDSPPASLSPARPAMPVANLPISATPSLSVAVASTDLPLAAQLRMDLRQPIATSPSFFPSSEEEFALLRNAVLARLNAGVVNETVPIELPNGETKRKRIPVDVQRLIESGSITTLAHFQFADPAKNRN